MVRSSAGIGVFFFDEGEVGSVDRFRRSLIESLRRRVMVSITTGSEFTCIAVVLFVVVGCRF